MSELVYRLLGGVHDTINAFDLVCASQAVRLLRFQPDDSVLRWEMRWPQVLMVFFHCLWVWKGRTDVSERVYRLGSMAA